MGVGWVLGSGQILETNTSNNQHTHLLQASTHHKFETSDQVMRKDLCYSVHDN